MSSLYKLIKAFTAMGKSTIWNDCTSNPETSLGLPTSERKNNV